MKETKKISYPRPMLSDVDYENFGDNLISLTDLEFGAMQNYSDFLSKLEQALIQAKMIQIPEFVVAHLCCYLGATLTIYNQPNSKKLEPIIIKLLQQHAELSLSKFNHYLSNSNANTQPLLLKRLRENTPGSIIVQTMRLGHIIMEMMETLSAHHAKAKKQEDWICPQDKFFDLLIPLIKQHQRDWQDEFGELSINYAINQLAIQIGWLIGYFSYLDNQTNAKSYLDYGLPCLTLYMKHSNKMMTAILAKEKVLADTQPTIDEASTISPEIAILLDEVHQLSEKTYAKIPAATTSFQKQTMIFQAALEKLMIELMAENCTIKVIYLTTFYFWFTLDAPSRCVSPESPDNISAFEELENIVNLIRKTTSHLPEPDLSSDIKMLNAKIQHLKSHLPAPEELDNIPEDQIPSQSIKVNRAIHTLTSDYLKQDYHPEIIANVLFGQWLRLSIFYGVTESEWQKMDHYFVEILTTVREYLSAIIKK